MDSDVRRESRCEGGDLFRQVRAERRDAAQPGSPDRYGQDHLRWAAKNEGGSSLYTGYDMGKR